MLFTLLPWGLVADRVDERWVIATGLTGAAGALVDRVDHRSFGALTGALVATGALGASVNAASGRAIMAWFPRVRSSVSRSASGRRRSRSAARSAPSSFPFSRRPAARAPRSSSSRDRAPRARSSQRSSSAAAQDGAGARGRRRARSATRTCGSSASAQASTSSRRSGSPGFVVLFLHERAAISHRAADACSSRSTCSRSAARIGSGRISDRLGSRLAPAADDRRRARGLHRRRRRRDRRAARCCSSRSSSSPAC